MFDCFCICDKFKILTCREIEIKNECFNKYLINAYHRMQIKHNHLENILVGCFKTTLSKVLGLGIIGGSLLG